MADFKLSNGKEITFDFHKMTYRQWLGIFNETESKETSDTTIARVAGITLDELLDLDFPEYRNFIARFFERARDPDVADKRAEPGGPKN